jgi:hypothetical protein
VRLEGSLQDDDRVREEGYSDMQSGTIDNVTGAILLTKSGILISRRKKYWCRLREYAVEDAGLS